jgi:flagellar hook-length control protein FliK
MKTESVTEEVVPELITTSEQEVVKASAENNEAQVPVEEGQSSETSKDSSNKQSSEFENQFGQALNQVVTEKVTTINMQGFEETIYTQVTARFIFDQIVSQMKVISVGDNATLSFQLQPENLGKVAFSISNENGIITGQFMAENATVKEALEANLLNLKNNLLEQGIKIDDIKVVVGDTQSFFNQQERQQFTQNQQNKKHKHAMRLERLRDNMDGPDEMDLTESLGLDTISEHSVEFSA